MTTSIVEVIQHYQRSIDNSQDNEERLLYCIKKLYKLPIKVEHLQETGVGKTVNSLRKFNGEIGVAAKTLVTKWKAMVAAEEEPMDTSTPHSYDNDANPHQNGNDTDHSPNNNTPGAMNHEVNDNHSQNAALDSSRHSSKDKHKDRHKERSHKESGNSSSRHASSYSKEIEDKHREPSSATTKDKSHNTHKSISGSSSSSKEREKEKTEHKSRDAHKDKRQEKDKNHSEKYKEEKQKTEGKTEDSSHSSSSSKSKSQDKHSSSSSSSSREKSSSDKHKSSSKDKNRTKEDKISTSKERKENKPSSSHKSSAKEDVETSKRKRHDATDAESNEFKSPQPKVAKLRKNSNPDSSPSQENDNEDSFDSSMGANFGDILGMLNVPSKKSKKSAKPVSSSASTSSSSSSTSKDSAKPSTSSSVLAKPNGLKSSPPMYSPAAKPQPPAKLDLLAPTAKLEPLDPSIALELPTISTNYKPLPLNQTVMDCVFNTSTSSSSKSVRTLSDAEALQHGISSKTIRTKIYSGVKTGQILQVPSLFDMCIRILQKNIDALEYTGGVPFEVLRPVLDRATPQQLYVFEEYNPYLIEDSDVLWQTHVSRNYRTQKRLENESWREMYMRCQEEEEHRLSILKNNIKQSQKIAAAPVRKTQLAFVDSLVKPPRNILKKQEQYGTKAKMVATPAARVASLQSVTPNAAKTGDQRLKVSPAVRDHAQVVSSAVRPKKAPLMQKTLAFMRGRHKR